MVPFVVATWPSAREDAVIAIYHPSHESFSSDEDEDPPPLEAVDTEVDEDDDPFSCT